VVQPIKHNNGGSCQSHSHFVEQTLTNAAMVNPVKIMKLVPQ
jgi:hypothetical protein